MQWKFAPGDPIAPGRLATQLLGGGRRYEAWVAWNERLLCPTVIKVLRPEFVDDASSRAMIAAEAEALRRCSHPSFIRLFDADPDGSRPYLELEFVDGPRLSTLLRRHGILVPEQLFPLARQLASALHYLHSLCMVHLDVKPGNVIMGPVPRLIDLSVARTFDEARAIRAPVGTDAYMAPEQCDPALFDRIGPTSDVWGLGVTLYAAAAKQLPFPKGRRDGKRHERWPQLVLEPASPPRKVPAQVAELIMTCLVRDPAERPSPSQLFEAFDALATDHPVRRVRYR